MKNEPYTIDTTLGKATIYSGKPKVSLPELKAALAGYGLVAVPVEPTEAMLEAARDWSVKTIGRAVGNTGATGCYKAMIKTTQEQE